MLLAECEMLLPLLLQDTLMQHAAFQDVCFLAQATGPDAWRRKMVFAQDSGEAWHQIGTVCMDEVSIAQRHCLHG